MPSRQRVRSLLLGALAPLAPACNPPPPTASPAEAERGTEAPPLQSDAEDDADAVTRRAEPASPPASDHDELERTFGAHQPLDTLVGEASYYSDALAGRKTASGERYDPNAYTAAHRSLPFGTVLRVQRKDTGGTVYVRVNDRGPFGKRRRILDLSKAAARRLDMLRRGIADVRIDILERPKGKRR